MEDYMLTPITAYPGMPPEIIGWPALAVLLPVVVISVLLACATLVALFAKKDRAERADAVLTQLLDALRALYRCGPRRDTATHDESLLEGRPRAALQPSNAAAELRTEAPS